MISFQIIVPSSASILSDKDIFLHDIRFSLSNQKLSIDSRGHKYILFIYIKSCNKC